MNQPLFHPTTALVFSRLQHDLPQSLLISGQGGVGLYTIAKWLAGANFAGEITPKDTAGKPHATGTISVEMIRQLTRDTRSRAQTRQVIVIDDADRMSTGAQGAFLKLLEEPNRHTYFILTSHHPNKLLPTIRSRVQHAEVFALPLAQSAELIAALGVADPTKKAQLEFIAGGLPAELTRLASSSDYFQHHAEIIGDARDFLQADAYKKLLVAHRYRLDRTRALRLVDAALAILRRSLTAKPQHAAVVQLERLLAVREQIQANGNIGLQLARLVV